MFLFAAILLLITIVYYLLKINNQYWEKRGVNGPTPHLLIGNLGKSVIFQESISDIFTNVYNKYKSEDLVGLYRGTTPIVILRSPELIKEVIVKSFNNFHDNDFFVNKENDPILGRNPFMLKGDEWKIVRSQLTPAFTSGKMKWLYPLLEEQSINLVKYIENECRTKSVEGGFDAKEICVRFTLNNVASCAFGIEGKCFEEENSEFRQISKDFFSPDSKTMVLLFMTTLVPALTKYLPISLLSKKVEKKLLQMVTATLKYRKENGIVRNDFLEILSELKKTCTAYEFTDVDVTAQAAGFFGDGSETSSLVMSYVLFCLAENAETQKKLREEVVNALEKNNNQMPYDVLMNLPYMDAVINESLRLYPPAKCLQKLCTTNHILTNKNKTVMIEKDTPIILPVFGLHYDENYFEEPKSFKPERFLEENKDNLTKYAFLPFGEGPRSCLGKRFGLLQIKAGIAHLIKNYELSLNKKTQLPLQFMTMNVFLMPVGGLWLDFKKL